MLLVFFVLKLLEVGHMYALVVTCEHGGNQVPQEYSVLFKAHKELLSTHRGYDIGALEIAQEIARTFSTPFHFSKITRLLVDLNRSLKNPSLFSQITNSLSQEQKEEILAKYYFPYRMEVEEIIAAQKKPVLHLSIHSFTPIWKGEKRKADIGILYDPRKVRERIFSFSWQKNLQRKGAIVRRNYPYLGIADGLTTALRKQYPIKDYLGIELELNQQFPLKQAKEMIIQSLQETLYDKR